jgi:hypothetical protein
MLSLWSPFRNERENLPVQTSFQLPERARSLCHLQQLFNHRSYLIVSVRLTLHLREACARGRTKNGRLCDSSGVGDSVSQFSTISRQEVINAKGQTNQGPLITCDSNYRYSTVNLSPSQRGCVSPTLSWSLHWQLVATNVQIFSTTQVPITLQLVVVC